MCLRKESGLMTRSPRSPRSPRTTPRKKTIREPVKPRLSRKIVPSPRVNLNLYWSKFQQLPTISQDLLTPLSKFEEDIEGGLALELEKSTLV